LKRKSGGTVVVVVVADRPEGRDVVVGGWGRTATHRK
jgi:hypothetical protein